MIPVFCRVKHNPPETYGDCLRACVASILGMENPDEVPHFNHDGPDDETAMQRVRDFLLTRRLAPFFIGYDGSIPLEEVLTLTGYNNPNGYYILFGVTAEGGAHTVVCQGSQVIHNPAWFGCSIVGPGNDGHWVICTLAVA